MGDWVWDTLAISGLVVGSVFFALLQMPRLRQSMRAKLLLLAICVAVIGLHGLTHESKSLSDASSLEALSDVWLGVEYILVLTSACFLLEVCASYLFRLPKQSITDWAVRFALWATGLVGWALIVRSVWGREIVPLAAEDAPATAIVMLFVAAGGLAGSLLTLAMLRIRRAEPVTHP